MRRKAADEKYYDLQNSRSGMHLNNNELPKYFHLISDCIIDQNFYFLDVGCRAAATTVMLFHNMGAKSYGFDLGDNAAKAWVDLPCKDRLKKHDAHVDFGYKVKFDLISISHTLEHCYDPETVLYNVKNALKIGGLVWGIVPIERVDSEHAPHYTVFHSHQEHLDMYIAAGLSVMWSTASDNSYIIAKKL